MAWMYDSGSDTPATHHGGDTGSAAGLPRMAGMATNEELAALRRATGRDAEVLFLRLMIRHHEGGVLMARALLERSTHRDVVTLARGIDSSQTGEIETMMTMLGERGAGAGR
jgi:uncharacterized protein (DUF305 family)